LLKLKQRIMKNFLLVAVLIVSAFGFGQEKEKASVFSRKHELKLGALHLLGASTFEGTYEYIYSKDFTYGTSLLVSFDNKNYYDEEFSITPFARFYFQETKEYGAQGFFVEGFGKYVSGRYIPTFSSNTPKSYSTAALGICLGKKWTNSSGFVFEVLAGGGRTIGGGYQPDVIFRGDLLIGYRF
jgi:hypothetical protein